MKKRFIISLLVLALFMLFVLIHISLNHTENFADNNSYAPQENLEAPIEIPSESIITFQPDINYDSKPYVLFFYVDWCGFCRRFMPVFGEIADKYKDKYNFMVVNCDNPENADMVKEYHIMAFPSLFILDKKINHKFALNHASVGEQSIFEEELNNYLNVRKNFIVK
ncbi:MAG: thioredoxin [Candidatus Gastranaerophilales bacterium]|nr:thioredoxin [Candidatus Gastranaerophilales bacterium]